MQKKLKLCLSMLLCFSLLFSNFVNPFISFAQEVRINEITTHQDNPRPFFSGDLKFIVDGENLDNANLEAVVKNVKTQDVMIKSASIIEKTRTKQILSVTFDENNTGSTQRFEINFRVEGDTTPNIVPNLPTISVFPANNNSSSGNGSSNSSEENSPDDTIRLNSVDKIEPQNKNNIVSFVLRGTNFDEKNVFIKVLAMNSDGFPESLDASSFSYTKNVNSEKNEANIVLTLPENTDDTAKEYKIKFSVEGINGYTQTKAFDKQIIVSKEENNVDDSSQNEPSVLSVENIKISKLKYNVIVRGINLSENVLKHRVRMGTINGKDEVLSLEKSFSDDKTQATYTFTFVENDFDRNFKIQFQINADLHWNAMIDVKETSFKVEKGASESSPTINPTQDEASISNINFTGVREGKHNFTISGNNLSSEIIKVKVLRNEERQHEIENSMEDFITSKKSSYKTLIFPENNTNEDMIYRVFFSTNENNFSDANSIEIIIPKKEISTPVVTPPKSIITSIKANKPSLSKDGGETGITVIGKELPENFSVKIFKIIDSKEVEQHLDFSIDGMERARLVTITMPPSENQIDIYKVKVGLSDDNLTHFAQIEVGGNESLDKIEIHPQIASINEQGNKITLLFDQEIKLVSTLEKLKSGIFISLKDSSENTNTDPNTSISHVANNGTFVPLQENDSVEILNDKIIINLAESIESTASTKIKLADRIIKTTIVGKNDKEEEKENNTSTILVKKFQPIVLDGEFLQGEILSSDGGNVKIKITGEYLNIKKENSDENLVRIVVEKAENQNTLNKTVITPNVEYVNSNEIIVSFDAPSNETTNSESYLIRVSTDAGFKYSSEIGSNNFEKRFRRLITTVMPKNLDIEKPTLSYISIQSYGTEGGKTELPNTTHTELPTNQESKKTRLHVYGANLNEKVTKIKIIDEKGVIWVPISGEAASDSMDNFITVAFNGTGISGNGTFQKIEIICPRNVEGNPTYRYLLAVDGENFNDEITVTAKVLNDGIGKKNEQNPQNLMVYHKDETGKNIIEEKEVKVYSWSKFKSFGIENKKIDGYEILGYKITDDSSESNLQNINSLYEALVKNSSKITFVYKKTSNSIIYSGVSGSINYSNNSKNSYITNSNIEKKEAVFVINNTKYNLRGIEKTLNVAPFISNGRTMLPIRAIAEALDLVVKWDNKSKTATFIKDGNKIDITLNKDFAISNGKEVPITKANLKNNTLMVELKTISHLFNTKISWDSKTKSVTINHE